MPETIRAARVDELAPGDLKLVRLAGGRRLALANVAGRFYAFDEVCPHRHWPLSEGALVDDNITCPAHGWEFNVCTGEPIYPPIRVSLGTYPVVVEGNWVKIVLEPSAP